MTVGAAVVAVAARETATGLGVAAAGVSEGTGEAVGAGAGVLVVSAAAARRTIVGVDEAAPALPIIVLQPVNKTNKTRNRAIKIVFFLIMHLLGYPIQKPLVDSLILQP